VENDGDKKVILNGWQNETTTQKINVRISFMRLTQIAEVITIPEVKFRKSDCNKVPLQILQSASRLRIN
jgi:hypothetical protein